MADREFFELESEQIDFKGTINKYLRYWYLFVIGVSVSLAVAYLYLRYSTPQYYLSSTLLIKDDKSGGLTGEAAFSDLDVFKSSKNIDNEIEVLKAKSLMQRVFKELALYTTYYVDGRIKTTEVYGRELPVRFIISRLDSAAFNRTVVIHAKDNNSFRLEEDGDFFAYQFGQEIKRPYGTFTVVASSGLNDPTNIIVKFHDISKLANAYSSKLAVAPVNKSATVLSLSLVDPVPEKGKDIINRLIEVYNKEAVEDKNQIAANTIEFIDDRLKFLTAELTEVEKDVEQYKRKNDLTDVSSEAQLYLSQASEYNKQLAELEIQIDILNSIESYLKEQEAQYKLVPSTLSIQDPTLLRLITKFNELQLERERFLRTTQPNNPLVININEQLGNLRTNILENLRNIRSGLTITKNNLLASSTQYKSRIKNVPSIERELLEINRQQGIKEGLYLYLLQKREEAALSLAATVSNSRVIDPAMGGEKPVQPKEQMILLLALMLGLGLPFAGIYVKELLNDKVKNLKEVEKATATPVLGELSHSNSNETLVIAKDSRSSVAELFRLLRANLQFATAGKENRAILVTSSMSGEGKTFFSINLAASLVMTGKKVVILGFDLRKPRLMQDLELSSEIGITNYLVSDNIRMEELITTVPDLPGLSVIGSGPIPPNPAELLLLPKVGELIESLKAKFDFVIVDTAPVGQVADAFTLSPYVDSSIYLVRYNYTFKEQLNIINDIYKNKKLKYPMIVLNDAKQGNSGYGYGYGYGYGEQSQQRSWKKRIKEKAWV